MYYFLRHHVEIDSHPIPGPIQKEASIQKGTRTGLESSEREGGNPQTTWVSLLINHPLPCYENLNEEVQLAANATTKELIVHRQKIVFRYTYDNTFEFIISSTGKVPIWLHSLLRQHDLNVIPLTFEPEANLIFRFHAGFSSTN